MPYPFTQARNYTAANRTAIDLLVIHTMEAPDKPDTAENVANWFAGATAPQASAHYCIDSNSVVQCVRDKDVAWHAPGANHNGLGFEHAGFSRLSPAEWDNAYNRSMLGLSAKLVAEKCREFKIPAVWLSPSDLLAGKRGITSHNNVTMAWHRSDHTDPGPNFPSQYYVGLVEHELGQGGAVETKPVQDPPPTLKLGDKGFQVKRLQTFLAARGLQPGAADGIFGARTEEAVKAFQRSQGLTPDGIAGPRTWQALLTEAVPSGR